MGEKGYGRKKKRYAAFCPECGKQIPADSVYCEHCGKRIWEEGADYASYEDNGERTVFSLNKKRLFGAAAVFLLFIVLGGLLSRRDWTAEMKNIFYIKDNSAYGYRAEKQESEELSVRYLEKWSDRSSGGLLSGNETENVESDGMRGPGSAPAYSVSGRYFYYTELGMGDSFNLIRTDRKKKETKTLDSGVVEFLPAQEGKVIYRKENEALYYYDGSRKRKLASDAEFYRVSKDGSRLLWITDEDGVRDIYCQQLLDKSEPLRLERNAQLLDAASDLSVILVQKEDGVFKISAKGKKDKLVGEISSAMQGDAESDSFYFLRDGADSTGKELCYFSAGQAKLIDDSFKEILWQGSGVLIYTRTGDDECMMAWGGRTGELERRLALTGQIQADGDRLYFLSTEELPGKNGKPQHELSYVVLTEQEFQVTAVDRGVAEIAYVYGGSVYYYKQMGNNLGDLYRDGEWVAYDVAVGSVGGVPDGRSVLCIADASSSGKRGTLTLLTAEGSRNIADNVRAYSAVSEKEIFILSEFSREKRRGDLLLFDGQKAELLEADIWGYYGAGNSGICR